MTDERELTIEERVEACIEQTVAFWADTAALGKLERLRCYIAEQLPQELELARDDSRLSGPSRLSKAGCDLLVLLVGHSFEPLLQSVCVYQPAEVVPILNDQYSPRLRGATMYQRLMKLLPELQRNGLVKHEIALRPCHPLPLGEDTPSDVFRFLLAELKHDWEQKTIVIDITGAKKSMVAGAFFFAAYSNARISYVDFDQYDEDYGRPYGCTCRIDLLANPYRDFRLRDWAEVRRLYGKYAFAAAKRLLQTLHRDMLESRFFDADGPEIRATKHLLTVMEMYAAWDNGEYNLAWETITRADPPLPAQLLAEGVPRAVHELAGCWPQAPPNSDAATAAKEVLEMHYALKHGIPHPGLSIFALPQVLLMYVEDELAKVKRLSAEKEDYRAAFLRAVALDEFLLKARLTLCWLQGDFHFNGQPVPREELLQESHWIDMFAELARVPSYDRMRSILLRLKKEETSLRLRGPRGRSSDLCLTFRDPVRPTLRCYWRDIGLGMDLARGQRSTVAQLRGEAIHTHLYINDKIAAAAVQLAKAAVRDFEYYWLGFAEPQRIRIDSVTDAANASHAPAPQDPRYYERELQEFTVQPTDAPGWSKLCEWCGIDFLPPYRDETKEEGNHE